MTRVVICDPPTQARRLLVERVRAAPGAELLDTLDDPAALIERVAELVPDLVLLASQGLPGDTAATVHSLREHAPGLCVVLLTMGTDPDEILAGIRAGAVGYLARDAAVPEVAAALAVLPEIHTEGVPTEAAPTEAAVAEAHADPRTVHHAPAAVGHAHAEAAEAPGAAGQSGRQAGARQVSQLTGRELQVLERMSQGRSNAEIGEDLFLSEDTIKTHARRLFRKLEVNDRAHAVAEGFRRGILA